MVRIKSLEERAFNTTGPEYGAEMTIEERISFWGRMFEFWASVKNGVNSKYGRTRASFQATRYADMIVQGKALLEAE